METDYNDIDIIDLAKSFIRYWWLVLICLVIGMYGAYYYTVNYITPTYNTSATLLISEEANSVFSGVSAGDISLDTTLLTDYKALIRTGLVSNMIISELGLNMSSGRLSSGLSMAQSSGSRIVYLGYTDIDPERTALIANKYAEVLALQVREVIGADNVQIIDLAQVPRYPIGPNSRRNTLMGGMAGAAFAFAVIFLIILLDDKVKSEEDVEKQINVPVIGVIPKFKGVKR